MSKRTLRSLCAKTRRIEKGRSDYDTFIALLLLSGKIVRALFFGERDSRMESRREIIQSRKTCKRAFLLLLSGHDVYSIFHHEKWPPVRWPAFPLT